MPPLICLTFITTHRNSRIYRNNTRYLILFNRSYTLFNGLRLLLRRPRGTRLCRLEVDSRANREIRCRERDTTCVSRLVPADSRRGTESRCGLIPSPHIPTRFEKSVRSMRARIGILPQVIPMVVRGSPPFCPSPSLAEMCYCAANSGDSGAGR
jgi:hypothetical protein